MTPQEEINRVLGEVDLRKLAERDISLVGRDVEILISLAHTSPNRTEILQFADNMVFMHEVWRESMGEGG